MKTVKFVCFSDIQIEDFTRYSTNHSRLMVNRSILMQVRDLCMRHQCPALFSGDLFDNPKELSNLVLSHAADWFEEFRRNKIKIYAIDGNHDQSEKNSPANRSPNWVTTFSKFYPTTIYNICDNTHLTQGNRIVGIPYMTDKKDFMYQLKREKGDILLIHTSLPGLKEPNGLELIVDYLDPEELNKEFNRFKIVLNGHIHQPQNWSHNVYTLGATHHQRSSDMAAEMGLWLLHHDYSMTFVPIKAPKFREYPEGTDHEDTPDYWIEIPKEIEDKTKQGIIFKPTHSSMKLAKNYMEATGIKSKKKQNTLLKYLDNART